ncbi:MAG: hypothetical protein OIF48_00420 [Silicimonas sp.]|nr:hypothetical protein [Silicimonas sp.]
MKALLPLLALAVMTSPAMALTTQYTSDLEPYSTARVVAKLTDEEARQAQIFIAGDSSEAEKRAFLRALAK